MVTAPLEAILTGRGSLGPATERDAIDGVIPRIVAEPDSPEALADVLGWCSRETQQVVVRGAGSKLGWGRRPGAVDVILSTRRLNRLLAHPHGDLTATVEAGMSVADLNRQLALHGQWLPIDTTFDDATIGGTIAANDSGPLRHRHGTPRDLLLGVQLATADGRLVKSGGHVVKNVAGYDLGKLMSGSFGTLAVIATATFKLAPLTQTSTTLLAAFADPAALSAAAAAIASSQLEPAALDVHVFAPPSGRSLACQLLVRFASTPEVVEAQIADAQRLLHADQVRRVGGTAEIDAWREHRDLIWAPPGCVVRLSWAPASLSVVLAAAAEIAASGASVALAGRAGLGAGMVRIEADSAEQEAAIERLRAALPDIGHVVVLRADGEVKARADVWGPLPDTLGLLGAIKQSLDPANILNAGRGPI